MDVLIISHHKCGAVLGMHLGNAVAKALCVQCRHHTDGIHREPATFASDPKAPSTVQTDWHSGFSAASHNAWRRCDRPHHSRGTAAQVPHKVPYIDEANRVRKNGRDVRIIHLCRHPKEIVCSSQRYHSKCSEAWCNDSGYGALLKSMDTKTGVDFEMHNVAGTVVCEMLAWLRLDNVSWISHIPMCVLEQWDESASSKVAASAGLSQAALSDVFRGMRGVVSSTKSSHGTRRNDQRFTFAETFDDTLHEEFETLFPHWRQSQLW